MQPARAAAATIAIAALGVLGYAALVEPRRLVVRRLELRPPGWPPALDGLRVGVVGDVHAGGPHVPAARVRRIARRLARERPDLVAVLGDLVDPTVPLSRPEPPRDVARALAGALSPPLGVVGVLGNHDWLEGGEEVRRALEAAGVRVLENDAARCGERLWVAGVADLTERDPDLGAALAPVPDGAPAILLTHHPDLFPRVPGRVALTLAGHTHGSQVDLPLLRERLTPSRFGTRYGGGLVEEGGRLMYVTQGIGESQLPLRLGAPPEIALLTLRAG